MSYQKDINEFETLYKEYFVFLSLVSFQITKDMDAAKDIAQDFFVYLWNKNDALIFNTSFRAYANKAVKNLSLKHIEKTKKNVLEKENLSISDYEEDPINFEKVDDSKISNVLSLLSKLPEARKKIFISHVIDGLSYNDIAKTQNISINTVKTQMKRVYSFIRGEMSNTSWVWLFFIAFMKK
ncbi:sigma-70 family RNA polymerase sigma factor [Mariniflexile litorale]|uniref:Sigma-70 family RNA polymerase sigma factor n=1 Tax=Mariniflexile litorale TaxID=3045158 RepID=A0AAU7EJS6_9FLAO|nr:sigma-70 family RNA polymerase sigma factor [Mariniflexile sp. KMM 9835]MDQ8211140.1 sigma-70 family RNA polymerase sigma factor [Mariniflexile sp. KMM 9835]